MPFLEGCQFPVWTDNSLLKCILSFTYLNCKMASWQQVLFKCKFDLVQCAGIQERADNVLFSLNMTAEDKKPIKEDIWVRWIISFFTFEMKKLRPLCIWTINTYLKTNIVSSYSLCTEMRLVWTLDRKIQIEHKSLYKRWNWRKVPTADDSLVQKS